MSEFHVGGQCGYFEPDDDGDIQCTEVGLRHLSATPNGTLISIVRCVEHSDWIEPPLKEGT